MKRLVCEMCGSNEIRKDGGVFVCQSCGCQYTLEEARKMMVEGVVEVQGTVSIDNTVDVQGTVQVDNAAYVERYLANARRAKEKEDWEEVEKYYNMVEQNDPDNIEAIFYSAYGKAMQTLLDGDIYKRQAAFKVLTNCISVIDDHYQLDRWEENKAAIENMAVDLLRLITSNFTFKEWKNGYGVVVRTDKGETLKLFAGLMDAFKESIDNIQKVDDHAYLHQCQIVLYTGAKLVVWDNPTGMAAIFDRWISEEEVELEDLTTRMREAYWTTHAAERARLDDELEQLSAKIESLRGSIAALPESTRLAELQQQESDLNKRLDGLGMFKGKEKAAIRSQLEELKKSITSAEEAKSTAASSIEGEIQACEARMAEIMKEITEKKPEMPRDLYAEYVVIQERCRKSYFASNPGKESELADAEAAIADTSKRLRLAQKELSDTKLEGDRIKVRNRISAHEKKLAELREQRNAILFGADAALKSDEYVQSHFSGYGVDASEELPEL